MSEQLIAEIEGYAAKHGLAPATVTSRAVQNSRLYERLRLGGSCNVRTVERLRRFMSENPVAKEAAE